MSKSKKTQDTAETKEKVLTRYDLKMQRRKKQKEKEARQKRIASVLGVLILVGLIGLAASFPIRTWLTVNGTYIEVAGEKVSRVEFDYNYHLVMNNYLSQNSMYLSYMGLDPSGDLSQQMYSENLSWKDYFEQMAVDNIIRTKAMQREMQAAGFTHDTAEQYEEYKDSLQQEASESGVSVGKYIKEIFGPYATLSRIEDCVRTGMETNAYYDSVSESKAPSDEEISAYYGENKDNYDSVNYRLITVSAELPTEPTELADPADETQADSADGEETAYEPSEAEVNAAMEKAKAEADAKLETVAQEGELNENIKWGTVPSVLREWAFDSARTAGDTTVIEDSVNHQYYVAEFEERYLDQTPTVDTRMIITMDGNGQEILDEWTAGEATEESFAALADRYNSAAIASEEGGLYEGLAPSNMLDEMSSWLSDAGRKSGDTTVITAQDSGVAYVIYYIGNNDPEWKVQIRSILLNQTMSEYMDTITEGLEVTDSKDHLNYLQVQAAEEAAADDTAADDSGTEEPSADAE